MAQQPVLVVRMLIFIAYVTLIVILMQIFSPFLTLQHVILLPMLTPLTAADPSC